jgi:hypothetical protein
LRTASPVRASCETSWASECRIIINYTTHIQPLWEVDRLVDPMDPMSANNRCTNCHSETDAANATQVPAGQLDLRGIADENQADHLVSYRQLLFLRRDQELFGTILRDRCGPLGRDPMTGLCVNDVFATSPPPMVEFDVNEAVSGANASPFFDTFSNAGVTVDHRTFLNPAELRLISEWLDIGAQYYNDPFLAPTN